MPASIGLSRAEDAWQDRLRSYKVVLDGEVVGSIGWGEDKVFDVSPGSHTVQLRIDWCRSEAIVVDVRDGERAQLKCHGRSPLLAMYWVTFARNRYIALERLT